MTATLEIADNGIGIPNDQKSKIFDMFYRATEQGEGSGLGLYIVKEMLEKLGGDITIDSEPGQGTRITLSIPNRAPHPAG
jgi:signal transduction histidine kinase